jgi:hypothetical protein
MATAPIIPTIRLRLSIETTAGVKAPSEEEPAFSEQGPAAIN